MTTTPQPWFRKRRNQILVVALIVLIALSAFSYSSSSPPKSPNQVALNRTVSYFVHAYNFTVGLVPETPASNNFWLYSDNFLASIALSRYDPANQSTSNFGLAISQALGSYAATLPFVDRSNQYSVLNSTRSAAFYCAVTYRISWSPQQGTPGGAVIETVSNNGDPSCATQNYADTLLLQAILEHLNGNSTQATSLFQRAASDFNGEGFSDLAYASPTSQSAGQYQTYKLALYVVASTCLGASASDTTLPTVEGLLLRQQDNSTGGFYTGYTSPGNHGSTGVNTETTALAALALEAMLNPSAAC